MDYTAASNILSLSRSYQDWAFEEKKTKLSRSHALLSGFGAVYKEERSKLPFRLNLLDNLKINENAHSKFLIRILQHKPSMVNLMQFLNGTDGFHFDVNLITKPFITAEKMRIDGLIREDNKYAIIIENKIHDAVEQEHQIARYVDKCRSIGFRANQIYVIYLTRNKESNPTEQIWGSKYKQADFHTRYIKISYQSDIIPWIEKYAATLPPKEELLKSALIQYSDHLRSLIKIKKERKAMNEELRNFLSKELKLAEDRTQNIQILHEKIAEINELSNQMHQLLQTSKKELFLGWKNQLSSQFNLETFEQTNDNYFKTGVKLSHHAKPFSVLIEHNLKSGAIYYGFGRHHASELLDPETKGFLFSLNQEEGLTEDPAWWYGWKNTSFKDGYAGLEELIKLAIQYIKQPALQSNVVSSDQ